MLSKVKVLSAVMALLATAAANAQFPVNIGALPPGKSVTVSFDAQIDPAIPSNVTEVSNQGTVSGSNFPSVLTDDPDTGAANDPTVTGVPQADLEVTITDSADPVQPGDPLTYTVTVSNNGPSDAADTQVTTTLPAGVTFVSTTGCAEDPNGVSTCTLGTITSGGAVMFTVSVTVDGGTTGIITALASVTSTTHDPNPSNNTASEDTLVALPTNTGLTSSGSPTTFGEEVTFTATVTGSGATPTGSAEFFDGMVSLGVQPLNGSGVATLMVATLSAGMHSITAEYGGDGTYAPSTSSALPHTVSQAETTIAITSDDPDPSFVSEDVTVGFSVAVTAPGAGTPTGSVTITDGTDMVSVPVGDGSGTLALTTAGTRSLTAEYLGDTNFQGSTSTPVDHEVLQGDYGDAPDPTYPTLLANDGARHALGSSLFLGASVDGDIDGQPSLAADGDDNTDIDDEDGVAFTLPLVAGESTTVDVTASSSGLLSAWVDWNSDGDWNDPEEQIFTDTPLSAGVNALNFTIPDTAAPASITFARFRVSTAAGLTPAGAAADGEVEDYAVVIVDVDFGDAPDPAYATLRASDGARHALSAGLFLGTTVDGEGNGQPTASADGDDTTDIDDEDGVAFTTPLMLNAAATVEIVAGGTGKLNAWMDFNQNGSWTDAGEQVFTDEPLTMGMSSLNYNVPVTGLRGTTFARFRFDTGGGLAPTGLAPDGEVEDYEVTIAGLPSMITVTSTGSPSFNTQPVTFSATVTGGAGVPTGAVAFFDGLTPIGNAPVNGTGVAQLTTSTLSVGPHTIFANYPGDGTYEPSSGNIAHTVDPCTPASVTQDPMDTSVCEGRKAVFIVKGSGSPEPTVQWQLDDGSGFGDIPGETSNRLKVLNVSADMDGYRYRAVFTGGCGPDAISAEAELMVMTAPDVPLPQLVFGPYPESDFVMATDGVYNSKVHVTWSAVPGAGEYRVFRSTQPDLSDATLVTDWMADRFYNDYDVNVTEIGGFRCIRQTVPILYYYQVQARGLCGKSEPSEPDTGYANTNKASFADALPAGTDKAGRHLATPTDAIAVRLNVGETIAPDSVWGILYAASALDASGIAVVPAAVGDDLWVTYTPNVPWQDGETITMTVGATTETGHAAGPVTVAFVVDAEGTAKLSDIVAQPGYESWDTSGVNLSKEANDQILVSTVDVSNLPSLPQGAGGVYLLNPQQPYSTAQRAWIPVPGDSDVAPLDVYYLLSDGAVERWISGASVDGWLASADRHVLTLEGTTYLGIVVNHGGTVTLGYSNAVNEASAAGVTGHGTPDASTLLEFLGILALVLGIQRLTKRKAI